MKDEILLMGKEINPLLRKQLLALIIVANLYDEKIAYASYKNFLRYFAEGGINVTFSIEQKTTSDCQLIDLLVEYAAHIESRSYVRRLARQNALKLIFEVDEHFDNFTLKENEIYCTLMTLIENYSHEFNYSKRRVYLKYGKNTIQIL
jgi:tyrosyl-tRNA synthetase